MGPGSLPFQQGADAWSCGSFEQQAFRAGCGKLFLWVPSRGFCDPVFLEESHTRSGTARGCFARCLGRVKCRHRCHWTLKPRTCTIFPLAVSLPVPSRDWMKKDQEIRSEASPELSQDRASVRVSFEEKWRLLIVPAFEQALYTRRLADQHFTLSVGLLFQFYRWRQVLEASSDVSEVT